jgi:cytochrome c
LNDSPDEIQKEIHAFETWEGGKCRFCHAVNKDDRDRMAPTLYGIFGRPAGVGNNYTYSDALINMKNNGLIWTPETLDAFILDPSNYIPGNRMRVQGVKDPETRKLIVNYLMRESKPIKGE